MNFNQRIILIVFTIILIITFIFILEIGLVKHKANTEILLLSRELNKLELNVDRNEQQLDILQKQLNNLPLTELKNNNKTFLKPWDDPIPILVFVCNREKALKFHLEKLLRYRKSERDFPIIVSQDCDNSNIKQIVQQFMPQVQYIKHDNNNIKIPPNHERYAMYYKISSHYKIGLNYVFNKLHHTSVIITEDDLDISEDFFDYFKFTRRLLEEDKTLFCVSAWNDNGKPDLIDTNANDLFYRSDFFPGLGWMMTSDLWLEYSHKWPDGFWDDWIREPEQRLNRSCIRPEISRTSMTTPGKSGASNGLFFNQHLKQIMLNQNALNFANVGFQHLLKRNYDKTYFHSVYNLPLITIDQFQKDNVLSQNTANKAVRIEYNNMKEYTEIASKLTLMIDTKAGVPRTAYGGVVTCFINGVRLFVAPVNFTQWQGYNKAWEPPNKSIESLYR